MDDIIAALLKNVELKEQFGRLKSDVERASNAPLARIFRARFFLIYFEHTMLLGLPKRPRP